MPGERQPPGEKRVADHLVEGVVPADILARHGEFALAREEGARVQRARRGENRLRRAQLFRQRRDDGPRRRHRRRERRKLPAHRLDGRFGANAAARRRENIPAQPREIHVHARREHDIEHVFARQVRGRSARAVFGMRRERRISTSAVNHVEHIVALAHEPFRHEKSRRQLAIVPRRAHDDGDAPARDANLQRLLDRQHVVAHLAPRRSVDARYRVRAQGFGQRHGANKANSAGIATLFGNVFK
jgi:hypothetical protein